MAAFDHAGWVARARQFVAALGRDGDLQARATTVDPPVADAELAAIERSLGPTLPASLRAFFTAGAAGMDCRYVFEPDGPVLDEISELLPDEPMLFGGASLGPASELPSLSADVGDWADDTWVSDDPDQKEIWESALPFARMDNGDYLALDLRGDERDPPVVYLNHDDESQVIAPSFEAFLVAWEGLCYLGPEHWLLLEFTDDSGYLDAESARAARLRELFARASRG